MSYIMQVKLVPASNNKFTETEQEQQTEFISNKYSQTISDHSIISSDESTTFDKK